MKDKVVTNIRIDSDLKKETREVLERMGLDMSSAVTIYFKQICRLQSIPFEIAGYDLSEDEKSIIARRNKRILEYAKKLKEDK